MKKLILLFIAVLCFVTRAEATAIDIVNVDASEEDIDDVYEAVVLTENFMRENLPDYPLVMDVAIYVSQSEQPNLFSLSELKGDRIGGRSKFGVINIITRENRKGYRLKFLAVHELIHQYQASVTGGLKTLSKNMWLTEGMADVLALHILGNETMNGRFFAAARQKVSEPFSLGTITNSKGWYTVFHSGRHPYAKAGLAVEYLYQNYPTESLFKAVEELQFYNANDSMKKVFGMTVSEIASAAGLEVPEVDLEE